MLKSHPVFKDDPLALQLIAYYDDVEVCNPLGSHRGINKLGNLLIIIVTVYTTIINELSLSSLFLHSWQYPSKEKINIKMHSTYCMCYISQLGEVWIPQITTALY